MKTIHELLKLVLKTYSDQANPYNDRNDCFPGLCFVSIHLFDERIIDHGEASLFDVYLYKHKPKKSQRYPDHNFFWKRWIITHRIKWLKKHIKLTK